MFYYRAYASLDQLARPSDPFNNQLFSQFLFHRWGYAALLLITLLASVLLNTAFLLAYVGNKKIRQMPHWGFLILAFRDLIVTLFLIPTAVDWFVVNFGLWNGGEIFCKVAGFFDFTLATAYPLILISTAVILYTRRYYPQPEDEFDHPFEEHDNFDRIIPTITIQSSTPLPPSSNSSYMHQRPNPRPYSSAGSVDGYRHGRGQVHHQQQQRKPFYVAPNRPGSVTGSIEGRMAGGRMVGRRHTPSVDGDQSVRSGSRASYQAGNYSGGRPNFGTTSPIMEADNETVDDLWEAASLDYPGRDFNSPHEWDELFDEEVKYFTWHYWFLGLTVSLSLAMGISAALMMVHFPSKRPGCSIPIDPFANPHSPTINDAGFNFIISFVVLEYILPTILLLILLCLICFHRMADKRFKTYVKMLSFLSVIFVASRSLMDIIQLKALIEAGTGINLIDQVEIEYEIVLIWLTYLPLILNPVVYFSFLSEYRTGFLVAIRRICGCQQPREEEQIGTDIQKAVEENQAALDNNSKTQESNIL